MKQCLAKVMKGERLSEEEAGAAMAAIMDGEATPAQIGGLLAALAVRGETEEELLNNAAEHAKDHGIVEVTPELIEMIKSNIEDEVPA